MARIAEASRSYHYDRLERDAEFAKQTGRHIISRPDLLDSLSEEDRAYLLEPITAAVREFIRVGLGDTVAHERKLAVRGFARAYKPGSRITPHSHFDADVVVSIYLVSGGTINEPAADLVLIDPVVRGFPHRTPFHKVPVKDGLAVIFPAYLVHETEPTPTERIIAGLEYRVIGHDMEKVFTPLEI
jgi:hypothetical protein